MFYICSFTKSSSRVLKCRRSVQMQAQRTITDHNIILLLNGLCHLKKMHMYLIMGLYFDSLIMEELFETLLLSRNCHQTPLVEGVLGRISLFITVKSQIQVYHL